MAWKSQQDYADAVSGSVWKDQEKKKSDQATEERRNQNLQLRLQMQRERIAARQPREQGGFKQVDPVAAKHLDWQIGRQAEQDKMKHDRELLESMAKYGDTQENILKDMQNPGITENKVPLSPTEGVDPVTGRRLGFTMGKQFVPQTDRIVETQTPESPAVQRFRQAMNKGKPANVNNHELQALKYNLDSINSIITQRQKEIEMIELQNPGEAGQQKSMGLRLELGDLQAKKRPIEDRIGEFTKQSQPPQPQGQSSQKKERWGYVNGKLAPLGE